MYRPQLFENYWILTYSKFQVWSVLIAGQRRLNYHASSPLSRVYMNHFSNFLRYTSVNKRVRAPTCSILTQIIKKMMNRTQPVTIFSVPYFYLIGFMCFILNYCVPLCSVVLLILSCKQLRAWCFVRCFVGLAKIDRLNKVCASRTQRKRCLMMTSLGGGMAPKMLKKINGLATQTYLTRAILLPRSWNLLRNWPFILIIIHVRQHICSWSR